MPASSTSLATTTSSSNLPHVLDPSGLGELEQTPLIPADMLERRRILVASDNRFRSASRFLASLWREDHDLPMGSYIDGSGTRRKLGSSITRQSGEGGHNFLTPTIAAVARRALIYREHNALYDVARLRTNLIASTPLAFNAFALLARDLQLAQRFMSELLPGFFSSVDNVLFEHSPSRGNPKYTNDHSAFDVAIRGTTLQGLRGIVAIEVKYTESMQETPPLRISERYAQIAQDAELYRDQDLSALARNPLQQLAREHCLAQTLIDHGHADVALFVVIAPERNLLVRDAVAAYADYLREPRPGRAHFCSVPLERIPEAYAAIGMESFARAFFTRYLDLWRVDGELGLDDPPDPVTGGAALPADLPAAA